jgi:hypothetical protein
VHQTPGLPCALSGRKSHAQLGCITPRERERVFGAREFGEEFVAQEAEGAGLATLRYCRETQSVV